MSEPVSRLNAALEGRYRIERALGEGGMATVYLADDLRHERSVALKVLKPELAAVVGTERFLAEIKTTANLQHPHILPLFDSGEADGFLFYVMPYVRGESLRDRLDREHQLPVDDAVRIAKNVAEALDYAHAHGVIHRDIKPANILLQAGKPVVSDFGIALAVGAAGGGRLTETGLSLGTPHYMSPEQATGEQHIGPATDVYALGCVLYEMLIGDPPHTGGTPQAVLGQIIAGETPSALATRRTVPPNVDAVIRRSLEKLPADRFSGARGFAHALTVPGFRHGEEVATRPRRTVGLLAAAGLVAVAVLAFGAGWSMRAGEGAPVHFENVRKLTFDPGLELMPAVSPDGREVAFMSAAGPGGPGRLVVQSLGGGTGASISREADAGGSEHYPKWSPDGTEILFHAGDASFRVASRGGTPRPISRVAPNERVAFAAWSPDGTRVAYVRLTEDDVGIYVLEEDTEHLVTRLPDCAATTSCPVHSLTWSPDGQWIAFVQGNPQWTELGILFGNVAPSAIRVVRSAGSEPIEVASEQHANVAPTFLPDGRLLFVSARGGVRDLYVVGIGGDGSPDGEPVRVTAGLNPHHISVSADGRTLAYGTFARRQNIYAIEIPDRQPVSGYSGQPITFGEQVVEGIAISPDGEWIVYDSDRSGSQDLYRMPVDGGESLRLTDNPADEFVRSWSSDLLMGHAFNDGNRDVYAVDPDGLGFEFIAPHPAQDRYPDLSSDGRRAAFDSDRSPGGDRDLIIIERDDAGAWGEARTVGRGRDPRWSPSGNIVASHTLEEVILTDPRTGDQRIVFRESAGALPVTVGWLDEHTLLIWRIFRDRTTSVYALPDSGGPLREVVRFDDPARQPRTEMTVHDGVLYYTLGEFEADIWVMDIEWR